MKFTESEEIRYLADSAAWCRINLAIRDEDFYMGQYTKILGNIEHRLTHDFDEGGDLIVIQRYVEGE